MTAEPTPERTALTQQSTLWTISPAMTPSRTRAGTEESWSSGMRVVSSPGVRSRPGTPVSRTSFSAPRATASLAAAASASTL